VSYNLADITLNIYKGGVKKLISPLTLRVSTAILIIRYKTKGNKTMATITFTYSPSYDQLVSNVKLLEPTLEYSVAIPDNSTLFVDDVYYHVDAWLRGLGYVIPE